MSLRDTAAKIGQRSLGRDVRWAQRILEEYRAGTYHCNYGIDLAHEALGLLRDREAEEERRALQGTIPKEIF